MLHEVRGPRRACVADFPSILYLGCCILSGAEPDPAKEVPTIPISREIFASSSKVGASLVAPRARLPNPFFTRPPSIGAKGERRDEGGRDEGAKEGARAAIALSAVFVPNGAAGREAPLEERAGISSPAMKEMTRSVVAAMVTTVI